MFRQTQHIFVFILSILHVYFYTIDYEQIKALMFVYSENQKTVEYEDDIKAIIKLMQSK